LSLIAPSVPDFIRARLGGAANVGIVFTLQASVAAVALEKDANR